MQSDSAVKGETAAHEETARGGRRAAGVRNWPTGGAIDAVIGGWRVAQTATDHNARPVRQLARGGMDLLQYSEVRSTQFRARILSITWVSLRTSHTYIHTYITLSIGAAWRCACVLTFRAFLGQRFMQSVLFFQQNSAIVFPRFFIVKDISKA